jgi:hypothetical protein
MIGHRRLAIGAGSGILARPPDRGAGGVAMLGLARRTFVLVLLGSAVGIGSAVIGAGAAMAVEVGESAPNFTLPSTMGSDISLSDYRGKKWVLLEFYGADFSPT